MRSMICVCTRRSHTHSPQQACEDALHLISDRYKAVGLDYLPGEKFVAINKAGEFGCASMYGRRAPRMSVTNESGISTYEGTIAFERATRPPSAASPPDPRESSG